MNGDTRANEEILERHRELLEERIDPDHGLLDALLTSGTLSRKEILEIKDKSPFHKRNSLLLDYILKKGQGDCLIAALRDTEQIHIANYLNANGGECSIYSELKYSSMDLGR